MLTVINVTWDYGTCDTILVKIVLNIAGAKPNKRAQMCSVLSNLSPSGFLILTVLCSVMSQMRKVNEYKPN